MAGNDDYHVVKHKDGWAVKREGSDKPSAVTERKSEAVERGRALAKKSEGSLRVHGENGKIQEERTYRRDPYPPPG